MILRLKKEQHIKITAAKQVFEILSRILKRKPRAEQQKEHFYVIGLRANGIIIYIDLISIGGLTGTVVDVYGVFRTAIIKHANSIIICHNHPSGEMKPSEADHDITKKMYLSGELIGIKILDHIIFSTHFYYSMAQHNELNPN